MQTHLCIPLTDPEPYSREHRINPYHQNISPHTPSLWALAPTRSVHYNADLDRPLLKDMCVALVAHLLALLALFLPPTEIIYSWVFNELPSFVAEDSRRFISQETGNLYISKVQPSDVGSYVCQVKNTVTNARVLSPPTPLTLKTDGEILHTLRWHTHLKLFSQNPLHLHSRTRRDAKRLSRWAKLMNQYHDMKSLC